MDDETALKQKLALFWPYLNERSRRLIAAAEARQAGRGGISLLSRASGLSRVTITKGLRELEDKAVPTTRVRREGAGRPRLLSVDPRLLKDLKSLIEPLVRGGGESPLNWISKSTRALVRELVIQNHSISHEKVAQYLRSMDYSLQGNWTTQKDDAYSDRGKQFRHINQKTRRAMTAQNPVFYIQTKKKGKIGPSDHTGRPGLIPKSKKPGKGPDSRSSSLPRTHPSGLYDLGRHRGFVNLAADYDTTAFALASLRGWWRHEGRRLYPQATEMVITANSVDRQGYWNRLWKVELQKMADELGLPIVFSHFPPGTHKWNKVEHHLFSFIASNWRGDPSGEVEINIRLIAKITTAKGLALICRLDRQKYRLHRNVNDQEMTTINCLPEKFRGDWNYVLRPRP